MLNKQPAPLQRSYRRFLDTSSIRQLTVPRIAPPHWPPLLMPTCRLRATITVRIQRTASPILDSSHSQAVFRPARLPPTIRPATFRPSIYTRTHGIHAVLQSRRGHLFIRTPYLTVSILNTTARTRQNTNCWGRLHQCSLRFPGHHLYSQIRIAHVPLLLRFRLLRQVHFEEPGIPGVGSINGIGNVANEGDQAQGEVKRNVEVHPQLEGCW